MTPYPSGKLFCGFDGSMNLRIWDERYSIPPEDTGRLVFAGEEVQLRRTDGREDDGSATARLSHSGRAVIITTGRTRYMIPRERFLSVAYGEEIDQVFFEIPGGNIDRVEIPLRRRGDTP